jgi:hypothetical protein
MSEITSHRRYLLRKAKVAAVLEQGALVLAWRAKQLEQPGTPLPNGFPHRARLVEAWYEAVEDVRGADVFELRESVGLSRNEAEAVLAALARIP